MEDRLFTDSDLAALNAAQTILATAATTVARAGSGETGYEAVSHGRVAALAESANDAIFDLLNVCNSHRIQPIPDHVMRNREPVTSDA